MKDSCRLFLIKDLNVDYSWSFWMLENPFFDSTWAHHLFNLFNPISSLFVIPHFVIKLFELLNALLQPYIDQYRTMGKDKELSEHRRRIVDLYKLGRSSGAISRQVLIQIISWNNCTQVKVILMV